MALPEPLELCWQGYLRRFNETAPAPSATWLASAMSDANFLADLARVWSCSDFIASACIAGPQMFQQLVESGDLSTQYPDGYYQRTLGELLHQGPPDSIADDVALMKRLRRFRQREMVRIIWRDFTGLADLIETTRDMTALAEAVLQQTLAIIYPRACDDWGTPVDSDGAPQQLVVLGMGKLGAWELNVSSDIDLIFTYPEKGETQGGKRQLTNQEFFIRLSQKLIKLIDERTANGFVFRVDMRLRPYGQSGALVLNFDAMEEYYQSQGRDWERYAMIKARVVAGDAAAGQRLMTMLRPFTYRRYIDYSAIQALRDMKALINREIKRSGAENDIKKGAGGIREVEFIAQAFQIIRGGRDNRFQQQPLRRILPLLEEEQLLPPGTAERLYRAYSFLRVVEHRLQGWQDQQTQQLPIDEAGQLRLAWLMGFAGWGELQTALNEHRDFVHRVFSDIVADSEGRNAETGEADRATVAALIWQGLATDDDGQAEVRKMGYQDPQQVAESLAQLRDNRAVMAMPADTRTRLETFVPMLISACSRAESPERALQRILPLVISVVRRSAYLVMLAENPAALTRLVTLCDASPWVADQLSRHPALLDELLDSRTLFSPPDKAQLQDELRQQLLRIPADDLEAQMEVFRYFRMAHGLRVAACEITEVLPLMKVSDYLTWLAEAILEQVLATAWDQMVERYGQPGAGDTEPGMVIIGYGKLGGIELGHGSDLDLVFLHNAEPGLSTSGERSVDNVTFFTRLGQRIIHILTARTPAGDVYEVDMRLRPSGNSGLLVSTVQGFAKYQQQDAWTWEHQALVRARPVAGSELLAQQFTQIRHEVLSRQRDQQTLKDEVREMRHKMREHLSSEVSGEKGVFDLKQDRGGIVDIEFMVQFAVLTWSHEYPELTHWSDNIRILESLEHCGLLSAEETQALTEAYKRYRAAGHRLQLQQQTGVVKTEQFEEKRRGVEALWLRYLDAY